MIKSHYTHLLFISLALLVLAPMWGCTSSPEQRSARLGNTHQQHAVYRVALFAAAFEDTNSNGYLDSLPVTIMLFAGTAENPDPVQSRGKILFYIADPDGKVIRSWDINRDLQKAALRIYQGLPSYQFTLSLLETGGDRLNVSNVQFWVDYQPDSGLPVASKPMVLKAGKK